MRIWLVRTAVLLLACGAALAAPGILGPESRGRSDASVARFETAGTLSLRQGTTDIGVGDEELERRSAEGFAASFEQRSQVPKPDARGADDLFEQLAAQADQR